MRRRPAAAVLAGLVFGATAGWCATPAYAADAAVTKVEFLVDASSGMGAQDKAGRPKIDAAREALGVALDGLGSGIQVGVRSYGGTSAVGDPSSPSAAACEDTRLLADPAVGRHAAASDAFSKLAPKGYAALPHAVKVADRDLGSSGNRHLVVVSSGALACSANPCADVLALRKAGLSAQIDVVALVPDEKTRPQLNCIANVTGGTYYDATDSQSLLNALQRITQRAVRGRDFAGAPTTGADTNSVASLPALAAGAYSDVVTPNQPRYFRIAVPAGQSVYVAATAQPPAVENAYGAAVVVNLYGGATKCGTQDSPTRATTSASGPMLSASAVYDPRATSRSSYSSRDCQGVSELVAEVTLKYAKDSVPVPLSLVVSTQAWPNEPFGDVKGISGQGFVKLPAPAATTFSSSDAALPLPAAADPTQTVLGGSGFVTAGELKSGVSQDKVQLGETTYYKTRLDWGQSATLVVDSQEGQSFSGELMSYGPRRAALDSPWVNKSLEDSADLGGEKKAQHLATYVPPVRLNNMFASYNVLFAAAEPGWYYFAVSALPAYGQLPYATPTTLRLNLQVSGNAGEGTPSGYTAATIAGQSDPQAGPVSLPLAQRFTSPAVLALAAGGVALLVGGLVWLLRR